MSLDIAVGRLVKQVSHWSPARWAKPISSGAGTRAEAVHALVQRIADAAASAEGGPSRPVPRLENDLALPDQLRVVSADLQAVSASRPDLLDATADAVRATAAAL